jgi:hypothetical protein
MSFIWILIPCMVGGIVFAAIAAWLTTKKGNTISDVLNSQHFDNAEAIKIEIMDKIKLRSNIPIVALYVIAGIVAIGLPAYVYYENKKGDQPVTLHGTILGKERHKKVEVVSADMRVEDSGWFNIPLMYRSGSQTVNFQSQYYEPLTLSVTINKEDDSITVSFSNEKLKDEKIKLDATRSAQIQQKMPLFASVIEGFIPENEPTRLVAGGAGVNLVDKDMNGGAVSMLPPVR